METKTYFATSIPAAMEVARRELGPEAMLLGSRQTPEAMRQFGPLEVSFAWDRSASNQRHTEARPASSRRGDPALDDILCEISALRNSIRNNDNASQPIHSTAVRDIDPDAVRSLCDTGLEIETASQIVSAAAAGTGTVRNNIAKELLQRIPVAEFVPLQPDETRTLAFIGPPGRGKTTSLIKIAIRHGLANRIPTRIFTAGTHVVGAAEQMARYAAILGVPFEASETYESLNLTLQGDGRKGLVLIDTSGLVLSEPREMEAMKYFFTRHTDIEKHLVLRADARSADMKYMRTRFSGLQPNRLLFTGVDEAQGLGAAADLMIGSGIPATFFGTGSRIPEDLEDVSAAKLVGSLWNSRAFAAAA